MVGHNQVRVSNLRIEMSRSNEVRTEVLDTVKSKMYNGRIDHVALRAVRHPVALQGVRRHRPFAYSSKGGTTHVCSAEQ